jgi:hypothetical protein
MKTIEEAAKAWVEARRQINSADFKGSAVGVMQKAEFDLVCAVLYKTKEAIIDISED